SPGGSTHAKTPKCRAEHAHQFHPVHCDLRASQDPKKEPPMSHFLDRLNYFSNPREPFSGDLGVTTAEDRTWEDAYRNRWAHDKIVRSTHGVNCTGSCSWKIYVKGGIVTWETQQTDYPR